MIAPLIPGLNDQEMPEILAAVAAGGAQWASYIMVRLPGAVEPLFMEWLTSHYPDRASKIEARLRSEGRFATLAKDLFELSLRRHGLAHRSEHELSTAHFRSTFPSQLRLEL